MARQLTLDEKPVILQLFAKKMPLKKILKKLKSHNLALQGSNHPGSFKKSKKVTPKNQKKC